MQEEKSFDWLAEKVVDALRKDNEQSWVQQKKSEFAGMGRLEVLRSLGNLDSLNLGAVCEAIGVRRDEMEVTLNVLRKI